MTDEVTRLGLEIDTGGVEKANASLGDFISAGEAAARQAQHLDDTLGRVGKGNSKSIDEYIAKLKVQSAQLGYTATQQNLIALASKGATEQQLKEAKAVYETIDAFKAQERAANDAHAAATKASASTSTRNLALGASIGTAIGNTAGYATRQIFELAHQFEELTRSASEYKDIEEKFGGSAESFAAIDVAAKVSGQSIQSVAESAGRLTKALTGTDDESKAAGAALTALNIPIDEFKKLDPVSQFELLGRQLAKFEDGTKKTAVAQALFARGGAQQLVFLKELNAEGGRSVIITQEQIDKADDYKDAQARARGTLDQYLKLIAIQALPGITAFTGALIDLSKQLLGVDEKTNQLKNNHSVTDFAESAAISIAEFVDFLHTAGAGIVTFGSLVSDAFTKAKFTIKFGTSSPLDQAKFLLGADGELADAYKEVEESQDKFSLKLESFLESDPHKFADMVKARVKGYHDVADAAKKGADDRQALDFDGKLPKDKKTKGAVTDKDVLGFNISELKSKLNDVKAAYADQDSILQAAHSAGLLEDKEFYDLKLRLLQESVQKETDELRIENELNQYFIDHKLGTDKDRLKAAQDIAKNDAAIGRQNESLAAKEVVLDIQRRTSLESVEKAYTEARIAAQQYLDTIALQHQRELDAFGKGDVEQRRVAGINQITDRYQSQRDELEKTTALLRDKDGNLTSFQQDQYQRRLKLLDEFQSKALTEWDDYYTELRKKENDATNGYLAALANISDQAGFTAKNTEQVTTNAFKNMEDAIVTFATTGKLSFKGMIDAFVSDIIRLTVQQQLIKPIANYLSGSGGGANPQGIGATYSGGGSGFGGFLAGAAGLIGSLFGGGSVGGGDIDPSGANSLTGEMIRGRHALGGTVSKGGLYQVDEDGPGEVLNVAGRKYLMAGAQGSITPNDRPGMSSGGRPIVQNLYQSFAPGTDRRTTDQGAAAAANALRRAQRVQ